MAQFFYDPDDDTVGTSPDGWTSRYESFSTFDVQSDGSRNYVRAARGSANSVAYAAALDAVGNVTDAEVFYVMIYPNDINAFERSAMVFLRASGTSDATANAYAPHVFGGSDGTNGDYREARFLSGSFNGAGVTSSFTPTATTPFAVRVQLSGTTLRWRVWEPASPWTDPTADEPGTWGGSETTSEITGSGFVGWGGHTLTSNAATAPRLYKFGVGTGGDVAPSAATADDQLATPTNWAFTAASSARQLDGSWTAVSGAATYDWVVEEDVSGVWTAFDSGNTASTSFQLTDVDGVDWGTTYRGRVRAVPAP